MPGVHTPVMGGCCGREGYDDTFGSWFSRRLARRYRRRGLDKTASRMVAFITGQGLSGASVLEIGGGVGGIQVELLRRGAVRTTNLELVDSYEADAKALAVSAGVADLITPANSTLRPVRSAVEPHDIVVLHRVVCCYHDYTTAAGRSSMSSAGCCHPAGPPPGDPMLVFSHPGRATSVSGVRRAIVKYQAGH